MTSIPRVILYSVCTSWITKSLAIIVSIVTLPIVTEQLGKHYYGLWMMIFQISSFLIYADLGLTNSVGRLLSRYRVDNDSESIKKLMTTSFFILLSMGIIVFLGSLIICPWIPGLLNIPLADYSVTTRVFMITSGATAILLPMRIGYGMLAGTQSYGILNLTPSLESTIKFSGIILLVISSHFSLLNFAIVMSVALLALQTLNLLMGVKKTGKVTISPQFYSKEIARELVSLGGSSLLINIVGIGGISALSLLLGRYYGTETIAVYGICLTFITHLSYLLTQVVRPMTTLASEFQAAKDLITLRYNYFKFTKILIVATFAMWIGVYFYGETFFRLLLSKKQLTESDFILANKIIIILAGGLVLSTPQLIGRAILLGVGYHWQVAKNFVISSLMALLLGIGLLKFGLGGVGAAIGWSAFCAIPGITFYPYMMTKFMDISIMELFKKSYVPGLLISLSLFIVNGILFPFFKEVNIVSFSLGVTALVITLMISLIYIIGLSKVQKYVPFHLFSPRNVLVLFGISRKGISS